MEVVLFMFRANGATRSFPLMREVTVIGRREDCDLRIPLTEVSRKHCRLIIGAEDVRIEDLGSSNGTFHNGQRIQESAVQPGDYLQVGPVIFAIQIDGLPAEEQILPPAPPQAAEAPTGSIPETRAGQPPRPERPLTPATFGQETMQPNSGHEPPTEEPDISLSDDMAEPKPGDSDVVDLGDSDH